MPALDWADPVGAMAAAPVAGACVAGASDVVPTAGEAGPEVGAVEPEADAVEPEPGAAEPEPGAAALEDVALVPVGGGAAAVGEAVAPTVAGALLEVPPGRYVAESIEPVVAAVLDPAALPFAVVVSDGSCAANPVGSGAWMFASARPTSPEVIGRKEIAVGAAMTIPIPAASRSIRWSSASEATFS